MRSLEDKAEELAFYQHDSNRAVAVVWPAIVENRLTDALRSYMRPDRRAADEMFSPNGALGTFGQKIRLGYMLGLYEKDLRDDLVLLSRIRNAFAPRVDITSFEVSPIRDQMDRMTVLKVHRQVLEQMQRESKPDDDPRKKTQMSLLRDELSDYRNSFHMCVRFMIHRLVAVEKALKEQRPVNPSDVLPKEGAGDLT